MPQTTIKQLLQQAYKRIDPLDAELLLAHVLKKTREFVLAHPEQKVSKYVSAQVCKLFRKRTGGIPLAYLTGHKDFFWLDFLVNKNVLVPRPETEVLVESVLSECRVQITGGKKIALIDVGTGSGCIPIAVTKSLHHHITTSLKVFAIDISKPALRIAKLNAKKHHVKIKFICGDLLTSLVDNLTIQQFNPGSRDIRSHYGAGNSTIIITANLPYLTPKQYKNSPSIQHEPKSALVAGKTGLEFYEKLLLQVNSLCSMLHVPCSIFLEIDPSQSKPIKILIKKYFPNTKIEIKKDLSGRDRVVIIMC